MNSVATYENLSNGFSGQSDFSATIGSACSSEEILYRVFSDNMFRQDDDSKKTVKFGDVIVEEEAPLYEVDSPNESKGNLLLSMFAHAHEKDSKVFNLESNGSATEEEEEPLDSNDSYKWYSDHTGKERNISSDENGNLTTDASQTNFHNDELGTLGEKPLRGKRERITNRNPPIHISKDTSTPIDLDNSASNPSESLSPKTPRSRRKAPKQKAILKEQNQKLIEQTMALSSCISVQQQTINNYESLVLDIQKDFEKLKAKYESCLQENIISGQKLEAATEAFESTKFQLDALSRIKEISISDDSYASKFGNFSAYSEQNYEIMRNLIYELQLKNDCLEEVCSLLSKKMNSMYRYTIAPALHLANSDIDSTNDELSYDSKNSIQEYMDASLSIFDNLQKLTRFGENGENYENKKVRALSDIESYFDHLNSLVVNRLEDLVRRNHQC
ncbi:hypothetical protein PMKS-000205 [Pichia membranifaciens]|uniref:Uncharacterized protein n=1 Tax=Pichia membranifaciens TaxID=4926 RepID=A0A1Q2YB39_9ASCO|nr:hypothetical protein PMKS-000205 [Pichia membranifaciens]